VTTDPAKTVEVPCPDCGVLVPVAITYGEPVPGANGTVGIPVMADKFEPWSHGLVCEGASQ
jgi:hypothetical protein